MPNVVHPAPHMATHVSNQLVTLGQDLLFWKKCCSDHKRFGDSVASIADLFSLKHPEKHSLIENRFLLQFVQNQYHSARLQLQEVQNSSAQHRLDHLNNCARVAALHGNTTAEIAITNILKAEASRQTFRKLRKYANGEIRTTLQQVKLPILDPQGHPTASVNKKHL